MESGVLGNLLAPFGRGLFVISDKKNKSYQRNANNLSVSEEQLFNSCSRSAKLRVAIKNR
ncbi:MAG: hypothetical protein Q8889_02735 [Candidatus Phytoplasma australasiaticum]|nr:hypothetical protein [Candidatus Phytoplasma australasiaticum]MDV3200008.1 hypothetical protein [Candidatus Phytoplasma australasiaticum]